jgi:hypothetical protein
MTLTASEEPPPQVVAVATPVAVKAKAEWRLETSVFAPRPREADCHNFWNTEKVYDRSLACDWKRLAAERRFWRYIEKFDDGVRGGMQTAAAEAEEIREVFAKRYGFILQVVS